VEQGTAANDNSEDKTVDKKGEVSAEEEGSEEPKTDTKKDKRTSAKSRKKSAEKIELKDPVTPTIERPARERKTVERYSAPSPGRLGRSSASKVLSIETVCRCSLYVFLTSGEPFFFLKLRFLCLRAAALASRIFQMVCLDCHVILSISIQINACCSLVVDVG